MNFLAMTKYAGYAWSKAKKAVEMTAGGQIGDSVKGRCPYLPIVFGKP